MGPITVLLVALGFLLPSIISLISSKADRNRDAGKAELVRARQGNWHTGRKRSGQRRDA